MNNINLTDISGGLEEVNISPVMKSESPHIQPQPPLTSPPLSSARSTENVKNSFSSMFSKVKVGRKPSVSSNTTPSPSATVSLKPQVPTSISQHSNTYRELFKTVCFEEIAHHVEQGLDGVRGVMEFMKKVSTSEEAYGKSLLSLATRDTNIVTKMFRKKAEEDTAEGTVRSMLREVADRLREEGHLRITHANEINIQCINALKAFLKASPIKEMIEGAAKEHKSLMERRSVANKASHVYAKTLNEFEKTKHTQDPVKIARAQQKLDVTRDEAVRLIESANAAHTVFYTHYMTSVLDAIQTFDSGRVEQVRRAMQALVGLRTLIIERYGSALPLEEAITNTTQEDELRAFLAHPEVLDSIEPPLELHSEDDTKSNASEQHPAAASESVSLNNDKGISSTDLTGIAGFGGETMLTPDSFAAQ